MYNSVELKERAAKAVNKKAAIGPDVNLDEFESSPVSHDYLSEEELLVLPDSEKKRLLMSGVDVAGRERGGTYFQKDTAVVHCKSKQDGIEVIPIRRALEQYDWVRDYYWKLVAVDADKYTAAAETDLHNGYVIRSLPGTKSIYPIQACLYIDKQGLQQNVHNIIIAEEDSELHIITGCSTSPHLTKGVHVGISEFFIKKNAKLSFTMIHNWAEDMVVRPRSVAQVEAGGLFLNKEEMQFQRLHFKNMQGKTLAARLDLPIDEKPVAYAIFAHCFTCTKNLNAVVNINKALAREGIAVLRFDFTGLGESEGDFEDTTFSSNVTDLVAAADFLKSDFEAPKLLIGHSLGGAAVLQAAARIPSSLAVSTIGAPFNVSHVSRLLGSDQAEIERRGEAEITLMGRKFKLKKQFLDDLGQANMEEAIRNLNKALIIFHSPLDNVVGIENAAQIFQVARHPKSFISLDTADHLLSNRTDSLYLGSVLAAGVRKYIELPQKEERQRDLLDNRVVVRIGRRGYQTEILANGHSLIADEPIAVGGANTGPSPYDYLVASLGACTAMTLRMYADRKQWPLESVVVRLRHQKIHRADCQECETKTGTIDHIEREIELNGPLDQEKRQKLLEIADKCPVHRTLHSEITVQSWLKKDT